MVSIEKVYKGMMHEVLWYHHHDLPIAVRCWHGHHLMWVNCQQQRFADYYSIWPEDVSHYVFRTVISTQELVLPIVISSSTGIIPKRN